MFLEFIALPAISGGSWFLSLLISRYSNLRAPYPTKPTNIIPTHICPVKVAKSIPCNMEPGFTHCFEVELQKLNVLDLFSSFFLKRSVGIGNLLQDPLQCIS